MQLQKPEILLSFLCRKFLDVFLPYVFHGQSAQYVAYFGITNSGFAIKLFFACETNDYINEVSVICHFSF